MDTLQDWFVKQGIGNLFTDDVAESEEVLVLLASEKQWDDINEICQNDLNIPKIKTAYLKAYLIKRTKELINDNDNDQQLQQQIEIKQEYKSNQNNKKANQKNQNNNDKSPQNKSNKKENKNKDNNRTRKSKRDNVKKSNKSKQKSKPTKNDSRGQKHQGHTGSHEIKTIENEPPFAVNDKQQNELIQLQISDIKEPEYKTNYTQNGFKYKDIAIVDVSLNNNDFIKHFDEKQPCIVRGSDLLAQIPNTWNTQCLTNKLSNNLFKVKISKSRDFRDYNMDKNYGRHKLAEQRLQEIMEMSMNEFINNNYNMTEKRSRRNYYLKTTLNDLEVYKYYDILKQCQERCGHGHGLISNYLCISSAGCVIPLKYKERDNIFISINGYTEIILFSPITTPYLYPFPYGHPCYRQSMANCEYPSRSGHGLFKNFNMSNDILCDNIYRCVLSKGDVLYIPSYWWREITNLNDFSVNIVFENKRQLNKTKIDINQIFNNKTIEQKIAIGRNIERIVFNKYGANANITTEIFKSFLNYDEKYTKYRSDVRKLLKNVFHENEIDEFVSQLVDGRYNVDFNQFIKHNND